jgi:hypothetical protein
MHIYHEERPMHIHHVQQPMHIYHAYHDPHPRPTSHEAETSPTYRTESTPSPQHNVFLTPDAQSPITPLESHGRSFSSLPRLSIPTLEPVSLDRQEPSPLHEHPDVSPVSPVSPMTSRPPSSRGGPRS